jgi:hypothetical protein
MIWLAVALTLWGIAQHLELRSIKTTLNRVERYVLKIDDKVSK